MLVPRCCCHSPKLLAKSWVYYPFEKLCLRIDRGETQSAAMKLVLSRFYLSKSQSVLQNQYANLHMPCSYRAVIHT